MNLYIDLEAREYIKAKSFGSIITLDVVERPGGV
jgi:hypothetical protein